MAIKAVAQLHPHETLSTYPLQLSVQPSAEASFHGPGAALDASDRQPGGTWPRSACRRRAIATMVRYDTTNRHACATPIRTIDGATSWFAAKRRLGEARAGPTIGMQKGSGAAPGPPRACQCYRPHRDTNCCFIASNSRLLRAPRPSGAAGRRTRPTPKSAARDALLRVATHTKLPRARHAPRKPLTRRAPPQPSHKTFRTKRTLAKKMAQNRPIPQWIRMRTGNKIRWNSKRRHWRRTKLGL